jgi:hypothetical protein
MKKEQKVVKSPVIPELRSYFYDFLRERGILKTLSIDPSILRRHMFDFFATDAFIKCYRNLALTIARDLMPQQAEFIVQATPTPRIFRTGAHGTSFHCDYWYGHGEKFYTVWTPLSAIDELNTFLMCDEAANDYIREKIERTQQFIGLDEEDKKHFYPVAPSEDECVVFGSKMMHGSPINLSTNERISFDFRIGILEDRTSTKNVNTYAHYENGEFVMKKPFEGVRFLRYVCGGQNKDTLAQHLVIDSAVRNFGLVVVGQEAEAERLGYPVLQEILSSENLNKEFNAIIIASESIVPYEHLATINKNNVKIFAVLENRFLH